MTLQELRYIVALADSSQAAEACHVTQPTLSTHKAHPRLKRLLREGRFDAALLALPLEEGHCLRDQTMALCGNRKTEEVQGTSLEMLRQMVGLNLGLTLLPQLAAENASRGDKH